MEMKIVIVLLITLLIILCAFLLFREFMAIHEKVNVLDEAHKETNGKVTQLQAEVAKLIQANRKRMPYESQDEMLNAMAALDALEHEENFKQNLIQNAKAHLIKSMAVGTKREAKTSEGE